MQKWKLKLKFFYLDFSVQYHTKTWVHDRDQKIKLFVSKMKADIRHFVFKAHAECALQNVAHAQHALKSKNLLIL